MQNTFRKNTLALAALLAVTGSAFAQTTIVAPASVTIYGRLDMALESGTEGVTNRTYVSNFASRLGFKGDKSFTNDLKGIFQIETGVAPDDTANSKTLASRNSFVGLSSATMGTLLAGTYDMPLKTLDVTSAPMWGQGDLAELFIHGKVSAAGIGSTFGNVHTRQTNVLNYTSPTMSGIVAKLAYSPDEVAVAATATVPAYSKSVVGASVLWDNGMFNAGYAYQNTDNFVIPTATTGGYALTANKIIVGAKMDAWTAGAAFSTIDNNNGKKTNNWMVSGTYAMGQTTLKASYAVSGESASNAADDATGFSLEADYTLAKDLTVYGYYAQINNGTKAKGTLVGSDNFPKVINGGDDPHAVGLGIRYNF